MTRDGLHLCLLWPWVIALATLSGACAPKAPPPAEVQKAVQAAYDQKMRWILVLEDERQLRGGGGDMISLLTDS